MFDRRGQPPLLFDSSSTRIEPAQRSSNTPDRFLAQVPGTQADCTAKALTLEGITCLLECHGLRRLCGPDNEAEEPFAVTLPVSIYVPYAQLGEAQEILHSIEQDDLIGDQWNGAREAPPHTVGNVAEPRAASILQPVPHPASVCAEPPGTVNLRPERTSVRFLVLLLFASLVLFLTIGR